MIRIIKELNVEVTKPNIFQAIVAKQYDMNTRFLKVTFVDCDQRIEIPNVPTAKVIINAERKDGQSKGFDGEINEDGTVTVPLHSWMLELDGTVICDISVIDTETDDNKKLTTTSFNLIVEKAAYGGDDITSDPQYDVLVGLIEEVRTAIGKLDSSVDPYAKYFDITADGIISLKSEYRGAAGKKFCENDNPSSASLIPDSISDNGALNVGSKYHELPTDIHIPLTVNGIEVQGYQKGLFAFNERIKSVTLNPNVTTVNNTFLYRAVNCEEVKCTEHITSVNNGAFSATKIKKIELPNLATMGNNVFKQCTQLEYADIGKVTVLGKYTFMSCHKLKEVRVANPLISIGEGAFYTCFNLRTVDNIVSPDRTLDIAKFAFYKSRPTYPWETLTKCTFGTGAVADKMHTDKFWKNVPFVPCSNKALSFLNQKDIRWVDTIMDASDNSTFETACVPLSVMGAYCSLNNVSVDDAREFIDICKFYGTSLAEIDGYIYKPDNADFYTKMGLQVEEVRAPWNAESLTKLYQALADGKYAILKVGSDVGSDVAADCWVGHVIAVTGVTATGELLIQDPSNQGYMFEIPENASGKVPIQNLICSNYFNPSVQTTPLQLFTIISKAVTS